MIFSRRVLHRVVGGHGQIVIGPSGKTSLPQIKEFHTTRGETVFFGRFYPSIERSMIMEHVGMTFPRICAVCGAEATKSIPLQPIGVCNTLRSLLPFGSPTRVPHCYAHSGGKTCHLALEMAYRRTAHLEIVCLSLCYAFIRDFGLFVMEGQMAPPWIVFKNSDPRLGWGQGLQEAWRLLGWEPYWSQLTADDRKKYVQQWNAPADWTTFLMEPDPRNAAR